MKQETTIGKEKGSKVESRIALLEVVGKPNQGELINSI